MRRKIMECLKKWQTAKNRLPLLLYGARQVGKTYILREFGRSCFENTVYVNFEEDKALAGYLEVKLTPAYDDVVVKMTLNELEKILDERFYRVGRSVIVNLNEVSRVTRTEIKLLDGTSIHLPRGAYDGVNRAIINMR